MSMYVDLLSNALDSFGDDLSGPALLAYVLDCRTEMLRAGPPHGGTDYILLVAELAYDRSLIKLAEAHGIFVEPTNFKFPQQERAHLESELLTAGVDLAALSRSRFRY